MPPMMGATPTASSPMQFRIGMCFSFLQLLCLPVSILVAAYLAFFSGAADSTADDAASSSFRPRSDGHHWNSNNISMSGGSFPDSSPPAKGGGGADTAPSLFSQFMIGLVAGSVAFLVLVRYFRSREKIECPMPDSVFVPRPFTVAELSLYDGMCNSKDTVLELMKRGGGGDRPAARAPKTESALSSGSTGGVQQVADDPAEGDEMGGYRLADGRRIALMTTQAAETIFPATEVESQQRQKRNGAEHSVLRMDPNYAGLVFVSVRGSVYNVAPHFYGPEGPYAVFAGKDVSRQFAKVKIGSDESNMDWTVDLSPDQVKSLDEWEERFREKYTVVGWLSETLPLPPTGNTNWRQRQPSVASKTEERSR